ncbi:outer membrane protein assembly factor BamE [Coraliomargarita algicola]|uniref:Outer membrane protein assembly factor BamE n=1 Tax=Coraliomargarita algicola TaxID=3092156 RepID=A0ABZ0REP3_9BACT|nr:outer membrane protein assembly factor BamE [Coraliomargarita sp. J2-16]WPJ94496.1 outer membrane protein assembly factor BamE [Coraliomargarita sp. J2-16]
MKNHKNYLLLLLFNVFLLNLGASEVTKEEFMALAQRVEQLEAALRVSRDAQVSSIATEAFAAMPMSAADRESLVESVVKTIQTREEDANYPWMDAAKWAKLHEGMTPEDVLLELGRPTLNEPSLHRRIDKVYTYKGKRVATAQKVEGIIRFYKGKVVEIEVPSL